MTSADLMQVIRTITFESKLLEEWYNYVQAKAHNDHDVEKHHYVLLVQGT